MKKIIILLCIALLACSCSNELARKRDTEAIYKYFGTNVQIAASPSRQGLSWYLVRNYTENTLFEVNINCSYEVGVVYQVYFQTNFK